MDDFGFDSSVWATPSTQDGTSPRLDEPGSSSFSALSPSASKDRFVEDSEAFGDDDFEFSAPVTTLASTAEGEDDDFDDFGDFGDNDSNAFADAEPASFTTHNLEARPVPQEWEPLRLDPLPSRTELRQGIGDILGPFWDSSDCSQYLTDEDIRQVGGLSQILVTEERCVV